MNDKKLINTNIWEKSGRWRRLLLLILIVLPTILAAQVMYSLLPARGYGLNIIMTSLFAILFAWISIGFWSSLAGMLVMLKRGDRFAVLSNNEVEQALDDFRVALLFPIYNEDAAKVAEGIRTVRESLARNSFGDHFDIFILSDSTNPDIWVAEEEAWKSLNEEYVGGRIFYRHRQFNLKRKSGNIAEFCRRWGADYRYMVIFDADSLMSSETLLKLVQAMEINQEIGIIQTPPKAIFSQTPLARVQQFAGYLYGPIFAAGLHFWQLGDAQYWGHNAIIRTKPFIDHCQLPRLAGKSPLSGEILSHDFVESALMRRAGYGVWLAYDLGGSWEQNPPTLVDELIRDRRWCQGNLQHSRLVFTKGFFPTHRALFINGIMSYGSALLWFFFLMASSVEAVSTIIATPNYFPEGLTLFPDWPRYFPTWALTLLSSTAGLLFLPKILAGLMVIFRGEAKCFGGILKMTLSILLEVLVSTFLAPVRMLFHSFFVVTTLLGVKVSWNTQNRVNSGLTWGAAIRFHWFGSVLGTVWGLLIYLISPSFFYWLSPVALGLALSIPLSVFTSRVSLGNLLARLGLLLTPAETETSKDILKLIENLKREKPYSPFNISPGEGFKRAVVIPEVLGLHLHVSAHNRRNSPLKSIRLGDLVEKAATKGPDSLSNREKKIILNDRKALLTLHWMVWKLEGDRAKLWGF